MSVKRIKTTFQLRRGTAEAWSRVNPILRYGEPGFERDTNKLKIGDGIHLWNNLPYFEGTFPISPIDDTDKIILYGGSAVDVMEDEDHE